MHGQNKAIGVVVKKRGARTTSKGGITAIDVCMNHGFYGADLATAAKPNQCPVSPLLSPPTTYSPQATSHDP